MGGGAEGVLSLTAVEAAADWPIQEEGASWFVKWRKWRGRGLEDEGSPSDWLRKLSRLLGAAVARGWI